MYEWKHNALPAVIWYHQPVQFTDAKWCYTNTSAPLINREITESDLLQSLDLRFLPIG
jgi:hypothetical protein